MSRVQCSSDFTARGSEFSNKSFLSSVFSYQPNQLFLWCHAFNLRQIIINYIYLGPRFWIGLIRANSPQFKTKTAQKSCKTFKTSTMTVNIVHIIRKILILQPVQTFTFFAASYFPSSARGMLLIRSPQTLYICLSPAHPLAFWLVNVPLAGLIAG